MTRPWASENRYTPGWSGIDPGAGRYSSPGRVVVGGTSLSVDAHADRLRQAQSAPEPVLLADRKLRVHRFRPLYTGCNLGEGWESYVNVGFGHQLPSVAVAAAPQ